RTKAEVWDEHFTELFYRGLRMFGTDFMMISKMFPGRNRRQIKLKFCTEERRNPARVRDVLLGPRETVTLEEMSQMTDTVYDDPAVVQAELDEERRRMEADHEREKQAKEESMRMSGADQPMPSIEGANGGGIRARFRPRGKGAFGGGSAKMGGGSEEILGTID
ncbi:Transcription factor TFIIIB component B, partial [Ascosphaera acerosa]